ncbi:hypothetical protein CBR_g31907 [Chara braunii]|uniref:Uncharacterized protein n=1 Tax=Chara braunii TaxID=69332 RepID=A0A388LFZ4_CHABU|nr:hypothetical protein CBR_g31907 [Chara braunii]|eukprot:GBG81235.1 hypothetical protein CBR_g31907 [Chara braunii]
MEATVDPVAIMIGIFIRITAVTLGAMITVSIAEMYDVTERGSTSAARITREAKTIGSNLGGQLLFVSSVENLDMIEINVPGEEGEGGAGEGEGGAPCCEAREDRKEEKLRRDEIARERFRKEMRMQISMDVGGLGEHLERKINRVIDLTKGNGKVEEALSEEESYKSENSDVEALSNQAENLTINEKRKRGPEEEVGDSPPMETPAKRSAKRGTLDPVRLTKRLQLSCRRPPLKKTPPRKTPRRSVGKNKIPAAAGPMGTLRFVTENLKALGNTMMDQLKETCRLEDVQYVSKKMERFWLLPISGHRLPTDRTMMLPRWRPWSMTIWSLLPLKTPSQIPRRMWNLEALGSFGVFVGL